MSSTKIQIEKQALESLSSLDLEKLVEKKREAEEAKIQALRQDVDRLRAEERGVSEQIKALKKEGCTIRRNIRGIEMLLGTRVSSQPYTWREGEFEIRFDEHSKKFPRPFTNEEMVRAILKDFEGNGSLIPSRQGVQGKTRERLVHLVSQGILQRELRGRTRFYWRA